VKRAPPRPSHQTRLVLPKIKQIASKPALQFWLLAIFLTVLFATGGGSRIDVQSLVILRPLSVVIFAIACITVRREHLTGRKWLLGSISAAILIAILHVIPLPPSVWQALPGRQEILEVDKLAAFSDIWRPLTLTPMNGWHAVGSLFVPLAVILMGIQLSRDDLFRLLPLLIALAALSGLLGLLQAIGDPNGPLYLYRITNNGSAVGLFANRNHAATLLACVFPMLAVLASTATGVADEIRFRQLIAAAIALVLVPLVLVTGSRSGLVTTFIGLAGAAILYRRPTEGRVVRRGSPNRIKALPIFGGLVVICLGFLTFFFSRAQAIERLFIEPSGKDARTDFWIVSFELFWKYFPWGSGSGSYVEAFQISEPAKLLDATYLNHAHNDWIEISVTFGLIGVAALTVFVIGFIRRSLKLWRNTDSSRKSTAYGRMASVTILIIAIASVSDYPLRTPTMMGVFAIILLWLSEPGREQRDVLAQRGEG
jgi:O-Antigen ligase